VPPEGTGSCGEPRNRPLVHHGHADGPCNQVRALEQSLPLHGVGSALCILMLRQFRKRALYLSRQIDGLLRANAIRYCYRFHAVSMVP
jgi:hypothetical protein